MPPVLDPQLHDVLELRVQVHPLAAHFAVHAVRLDFPRVRVVLEELAALSFALARSVPPGTERPARGLLVPVLLCVRASRLSRGAEGDW